MNIVLIDSMNVIVPTIHNVVTLSFNDLYAAITMDNDIIYVYSLENVRNLVIDIIKDKSILKLVGKPSLHSLINKTGTNSVMNFHNCRAIGAYINDKKASRLVPNMKFEIIEAGWIKDDMLRAATITSIMMKYKLLSDNYVHIPTQKKYMFNDIRNGYHLHLTAFNDILSTHGPTKFEDLIKYISTYPYLGRKILNAENVLNDLVNANILKFSEETKIIYLPDQQM